MCFQNELQKLEKQLESSEADKSQLSMSLKETKENLEKTRGELTSQQVINYFLDKKNCLSNHLVWNQLFFFFTLEDLTYLAKYEKLMVY